MSDLAITILIDNYHLNCVLVKTGQYANALMISGHSLQHAVVIMSTRAFEFVYKN